MGWLNPLRDWRRSHRDNRERHQRRISCSSTCYRAADRFFCSSTCYRAADRFFCILWPDNSQFQEHDSATDLRNDKNVGRLSHTGLG
jgi:hypothetical protein